MTSKKMSYLIDLSESTSFLFFIFYIYFVFCLSQIFVYNCWINLVLNEQLPLSLHIMNT